LKEWKRKTHPHHLLNSAKQEVYGIKINYVIFREFGLIWMFNRWIRCKLDKKKRRENPYLLTMRMQLRHCSSGGI